MSNCLSHYQSLSAILLSSPSLRWVILGVIACCLVGCLLFPWARVWIALKAADTLSRMVWVWAVSSLVCFAVTNAVFYQTHLADPQNAPNAAMVFSVFWAISVAILILLLIFSIPDVQPGYGVLGAIAGGVIGWLLGMYISPEGTSEQQQFAKIGTAVVGLFSGYTLKIVIDWLSKDESKKYRIYCGLLVLSALVSMAAVYNTRAYGNKEVKISFPEAIADPVDKQKVIVTKQAEKPVDITFTAAVTGVPDTSIAWEIVTNENSSAAGSVENATVSNGRFAATAAGTYKVQARSNYDARLVDVVEVQVK